LLTVARLSEARKNVDQVLRALALLKDRHDFRYTIVGDGYDRPRLETLAKELGIEERVRFAGFVSQEELLDTYAQSDLMILTSAVIPGSHEGFGIVYLEAAASGVPCLAARLGGAAEAVEEGRSGFFVETPAVDALAAALGRFLRREIRFEQEACREFARRFLWKNVVDHALKYYPAKPS
jgi:phosphatidylinositol alpha-1,6-mannosyltransferase